jgi:hypothetical protein
MRHKDWSTSVVFEEDRVARTAPSAGKHFVGLPDLPSQGDALLIVSSHPEGATIAARDAHRGTPGDVSLSGGLLTLEQAWHVGTLAFCGLPRTTKSQERYRFYILIVQGVG